MSSLAVGLRSESRFPLVAGVSKKPFELPVDCFSRVFSFLNPTELASVEQVNRTWRGMISAKDQDLWKEQCRIQGVPVVSPYIQQALGDYFSEKVVGQLDGVLSLITEYDDAGVNYKEQAAIPRGCIKLYEGSRYMRENQGIGLRLSDRWGSDSQEPFASIRVFSLMKDPQTLTGVFVRSWHENPPATVQSLPSFVPLRLFINKDGSYKNNGDKVNVIWKGKKLILTCTHNPRRIGSISINSFREAVARRVEGTLSCGFVTKQSMQQAKDKAAISGEWIDSN